MNKAITINVIEAVIKTPSTKKNLELSGLIAELYQISLSLSLCGNMCLVMVACECVVYAMMYVCAMW